MEESLFLEILRLRPQNDILSISIPLRFKNNTFSDSVDNNPIPYAKLKAISSISFFVYLSVKTILMFSLLTFLRLVYSEHYILFPFSQMAIKRTISISV